MDRRPVSLAQGSPAVDPKAAWGYDQHVETTWRQNVGGTILLVEDNDDCGELFTTILRHLGYATHRCCNGLDGIKTAIGILPDLILMDLIMPMLGGIEATRRIKSNKTTQRVPIVVLTASISTELRVRAYEAGADEVLIKPVKIATLRDALRRHRVCRGGNLQNLSFHRAGE